MISKETFTKRYIKELQSNSKRYPILIERTIYSFGLLEAIAKVNMSFIFKGGTCLMLLLDHPQRLSTDIDIIVEPGTSVEEYIKRTAMIFPFKNYEEQIRIGKNNIKKRHFKFIYDSPVSNKEFYILLNILYENSLYEKIEEHEIKNDLLITEGESLKVKIPSIECILADKLTAFAPHTTGIPLGIGKDMEVMKQLYDISTLIDKIEDFEQVKQTYQRIAQSEIAYRGIDINPNHCLQDTFNASLCIISKGKYNSNDYPLYVAGIRNLRGHIYAENYSTEIATLRAVKTAYLSVCLLADIPFTHIEDYSKYINERLTQKELIAAKYLRKVDSMAYAYLIKIDRILAHLRSSVKQSGG